MSDSTYEVSSRLALWTASLPKPQAAPAAASEKKADKKQDKKSKKKDGKKKDAKPAVAEPPVVPAGPVRPVTAPVLSDTQKDVAASTKKEQFYVTTAINYTNGAPHIGHAYEAITTDVIARYHRMFGRDVFFLTGSDEHGQKVEAKALEMGVSPQSLTDKYSDGFKACNKSFSITNDDYIRTTQERHKKLAQEMWKMVKDKGDIYLGKYEGWYNVHEEQYVTDKDAEQAEFKDEHGRPLERKTEESYFFRMSKYHAALVAHIEANPRFIQPAERRAEIIATLTGDDPRDLCISRTVCQWGVPCPVDESYTGDNKHVMYVWFDALTNYLSGIGYDVEAMAAGKEQPSPSAKYWPASAHVIGKDIVRFHTIYWPCMLMSAGVPLPQTVFAHGFVLDKDQKKMGKSLGNAIAPKYLSDTYPVDSVRFYIVHGAPYGGDLGFNEEVLCDTHNSFLNDALGNLLNRSVHLCRVHCNGVVPNVPAHKHEGVFPIDVNALRAQCETFMSALPAAAADGSAPEGFQLHMYSRALVEATNQANKFLTQTELWHIKKEEATLPLRQAIVRTIIESVYILAHFYSAICVERGPVMFEQVGVAAMPISVLSPNFDNLAPGVEVVVGDVLYPSLKVGGIITKQEQSKGSGEKVSFEEAKRIKKEKQKAKAAANSKKKAAGGGAAAAEDQPLWSKIDIRVGTIVKAWPHPDAEKLYCEEIDVGEDKPRMIASGLRAWYTEEEMQGRQVLAVCNLKSSKMKGFESQGMVLCAKSEDKVEFVSVPEGSKNGDRITLEGESLGQFEPLGPNQVKKKKVWEAIALTLKTDADRVACSDGKKLVDARGVACIAPTVALGVVS